MRRQEKIMSNKVLVAGMAFSAAVAVGAFTLGSSAGEVIQIADLPARTHVHGLAIDRQEPSHLLIATHHGLFRAGPDGKAERVSVVQDFMGFKPHPSDPETLYASGHPANGGNLGFIASTDKGVTWKQVSSGLDGPVDFHQMTVSPKDPNTIYGAFRGLQVSRDAGKSWTLVGPTPDKLIGLAASAKSADTLYAASEGGLFASINAGKTWTPVIEGAPVSLVEVTSEGTLYAFVIGRGLVRSTDEGREFKTVSGASATPPLLHLAVDPHDPTRVFAAAGRGPVLMSTDQGRTWTAFGRSAQQAR